MTPLFFNFFPKKEMFFVSVFFDCKNPFSKNTETNLAFGYIQKGNPYRIVRFKIKKTAFNVV
jgi:hypothetical protein